MINSMTGFGHGEYADDRCKIAVEIKAVNHRYLDINIKMPKKLNCLENSIRGLLKSYIQRGKADIFVSYEDLTEKSAHVRYHKEIAMSYMEHLKQMADDFSIKNDICASHLSKFPEVFTLEEQPLDEEGLWPALEEACRQAFTQFLAARNTEGEHLRRDLLEKCNRMISYVDYIEEHSPQILAKYREKLEGKVKELLTDAQIDENRLAMEVTIFADKICVDEETVRLRSHIKSTVDTLNEGGAIGRKLDFIAQEMNREANTILSKANDLETSQIAISLKTDIEKVREQIQNIE